jgi:hypothetical protein
MDSTGQLESALADEPPGTVVTGPVATADPEVATEPGLAGLGAGVVAPRVVASELPVQPATEPTLRSSATANRRRGRQWRVARLGLLTGHMTQLPLVRAARIPVTETYHGVDVTEDYRWLEDASSVETITWTKAQQQRARAYFDGIPWRNPLRHAGIKRQRTGLAVAATVTRCWRLVTGHWSLVTGHFPMISCPLGDLINESMP